MSSLLAVVAACTAPGPDHSPDEPFDPYEKGNRDVHEFNRGLDRTVIRPVSRGYSKAMPDDFETAIGRFASNFSLPQAVVNNILQGNMRGATENTYRFVVNTTVGLGGFFDPASEMGMPAETDADFGQTLQVWGVPEGAYLVWPVVGPATERDTAGMVVDVFTNPLSYLIEAPERFYGTGTRVANGLSQRARYSGTIDSVLYDSTDSYAQRRSLYYQNRRFELGSEGNGTYVDGYEDPYSDANEAPNDE